MDQIAQLVRHRIDNAPAGGTVSLRRSLPVPTYGYLVGGAGPVLVFQSEEALREHWGMVESFVSAVYAHGHQYIGWWTDPETEKVYLDVSTWHAELYDADRLSQRRGEIAFFDIENNDSLKTGAYGFGRIA